MYLTLEQMNEINKVQIKILKEINRVCEILQIKYFMVHGSLLGTIRNSSFVPYDDDIDIAMTREDYDKFINEAPNITNVNFFVQSYKTDINYPLPFAKVRDSRTTYVVESLQHIEMNHGIYVDIFPLDNSITNKKNSFRYRLFNWRIGCVFHNEKKSLKLKIKSLLAKIYCPSYQKAILQREKILKTNKKSNLLQMTGAKSSEKSLPAHWFETYQNKIFEGERVYVPIKYSEYLTHIYGDFSNRTLVEGKMKGNKVKVNACIVDTEKPYTCYLNEK